MAVASRSVAAPVHQLTCFTAYALMLIGVVAFLSVLVSF
jgi:hypothetical protein